MPYNTVATNQAVTSSFMNTNWRDQVISTVTSATRPSGTEGQIIYETDTDAFQVYNGSSWVEYGRAGNWATSTPTLSNVTGGTVAMQSMRMGKSLFYAIQISAGTATAGGTVTITTSFTGAAIIQAVPALLTVGGVLTSVTSCRWESSSAALTLYSTEDGGSFTGGDAVTCRLNGVVLLA